MSWNPFLSTQSQGWYTNVVHTGGKNMTNYLPQGYKLNSPRGEYTIEAVIGRGATAIAYIAGFDSGNGLISKRISPSSPTATT